MLRLSILLALALSLCTPVLAREWTDSTGKYKQDADLVDFDENLAVLKKADGRLVAVPREKLSVEDNAFLKSKAALDEIKAQANKDECWTMADGRKAAGHVLRYSRQNLILEHKGSDLLVNGTAWKDLKELHRYVTPRVVAHFEKRDIKDDKAILSFLSTRKGDTVRYSVESVVLELSDGEQFAMPLFLFSVADLKLLEPGWKNWLAAEKDQKRQEEESTMARSLAREYQKNQELALKYRIEMLRLAKDWFDLWEVTLVAPNGQMRTVVVPARDSLTAQMLAAQQFPGASVDITRKLHRRY